jgi:chemotaxis protein methyltransferase CheR
MPAPALPEPSVKQLAQLVEQVSGNVVPESFFPFLAEVAQERRVACGFVNLSDYVKALASGRLSEEWRKLLAAITIKESSFFRTPQHFEALKDQIIPLLVQTRHASRTLRLWSAGCARGEEPATLAMVLAEHPLLSGWSWSILATDVDEEALEAARRGFYSEKAVAAVPSELKERYFTPQAGGWLLSPRLLQRITYRYLNLIAEPFPSFPQPFDIIMLRNVLIYFRLASQKRVLANIATALAPDGFLFLGPAETVWQVSDRFEPVDLGTCFVYRAPGPHRQGNRKSPRFRKEKRRRLSPNKKRHRQRPSPKPNHWRKRWRFSPRAASGKPRKRYASFWPPTPRTPRPTPWKATSTRWQAALRKPLPRFGRAFTWSPTSSRPGCS